MSDPELAKHPAFKDLADLRSFVTKLIALWDRDRDKSVDMLRDYALGTGPMIWSLTNHTVELTRTIVELSRTDRMMVAMPLIRLTIDNAMTSAWLLVSPRATGALVHEGLRQRKSAIDHIVKLGALGFDAATADEAAIELDNFSDMKDAQGRFIEQRFKALRGGDEIYASYRVASALSHAGMTLADSYLREVPTTPEAPLGIAFDPDQKLDAHEAWFGTAASMLLVAMASTDRTVAHHRMKNQLAKAAKRLGISLDIALADDQDLDHAEGSAKSEDDRSVRRQGL